MSSKYNAGRLRGSIQQSALSGQLMYLLDMLIELSVEGLLTRLLELSPSTHD